MGGAGATLFGVNGDQSVQAVDVTTREGANVGIDIIDGGGPTPIFRLDSVGLSIGLATDAPMQAALRGESTIQVGDVTLDIDVEGAVSGETINFVLNFRGTVAEIPEDQLFALTLNVYGDGSTLLDTLDIYVLVPGTSY